MPATGITANTAALPAGRAHKRVQWRTPTGGKRRPGVIDATSRALVGAIEGRFKGGHGSLWMRICRNVIVAGYPIERALNRVRALRADGAESLLAMTVALLYLADVRSGYIGKPRPGGGRWQRYTLNDLAQLAYGAQGEADVRRARRSLDMLISLGWAFPTKQVRRFSPEDGFRSEAGVRRLNLYRLCEMVGTGWLLARDRQHADRTRGDDTASFEAARHRREQSPQSAREAHSSSNGGHYSSRKGSGPPERPGGSGSLPIAMFDILEMLNKG